MGLSARPAKDAVPPLSTRGQGTVSQVNRIPSAPATIPHAVAVLAIGPVQGRRLKHQACVRQGLEVAATYGLRVRRFQSTLTISAVAAAVAELPVRNPQFWRSPTEHRRIHDHVLCRFHMGCGLTIRRLKKLGPKKGRGKGPTQQSDSVRCRPAARNLLRCNAFRVGRRGLQPRTYGLKEGPGCVEISELCCYSTTIRTAEDRPDPPSQVRSGLSSGLTVRTAPAPMLSRTTTNYSTSPRCRATVMASLRPLTPSLR